jgi:hypothetical protein
MAAGIAFQVLAGELHQTGFPEKPEDLGKLLAVVVPAFITKARQVADQCDEMLVRMTPRERAE